jgi:plasmid stabilization system protein ParE
VTPVPHPLLQRDIVGIAEHVFAVSGDADAARRRMAETRELIADIIREPQLGSPLGGDLGGWRVRHGGRDRRISVVFRHDAEAGRLHLALVAFGGQDWTSRLPARAAHFASKGEQG